MTIKDMLKNSLLNETSIRGFEKDLVVHFTKEKMEELKENYVGRKCYIASTYNILSRMVQNREGEIVEIISCKENGFNGVNKEGHKIEGFYIYPIN